MAEYTFTVQDYKTKQLKNVEDDFNCKYIEFSGLLDFEVTNCYVEEYADADGAKVYYPETPHFATKECNLKLLFLSQTCQADAAAFSQFVQGRKIEWHDTFRNIYATMLCTKTPSVGMEKLYGDTRYREMTYTFTNVDGRTYTDSQIPT